MTLFVPLQHPTGRSLAQFVSLQCATEFVIPRTEDLCAIARPLRDESAFALCFFSANSCASVSVPSLLIPILVLLLATRYQATDSSLTVLHENARILNHNHPRHSRSLRRLGILNP